MRKLFLLLAGCLASTNAFAQEYRIVEVFSTQPWRLADHLSESGNLAGYGDIDNHSVAMLYRDGVFERIGPLGSNSTAEDINSFDNIVGTISPGNDVLLAGFWTGTSFNQVTEGIGVCINDLNQITGFGFDNPMFFWSDGELINVPLLQNTETLRWTNYDQVALNNSGMLLGNATSFNYTHRTGWYWTEATGTVRLPNLWPSDLLDNGRILNEDGRWFEGTQVVEVTPLTYATAATENGKVLGRDANHVWSIYENGMVTHISELLAPEFSGWQID
ncbi:MAG TPA: hypothetical protein PKA27_10385, partial [Fimbriimonadaceae bacterium]|nr:hypothetical protein [Fimbriimonadaceae bacterium]